MMPVAATLNRLIGGRLWLQVHGVDAWAPPARLVRWGAEQADLVTSVSRYSRQVVLSRWWNGEPARVRVLPNTVDPVYAPGPRPLHLVERYGLHGRRVLMTVSRLAQSERYKGQDRVLRALPAVLARVPDAIYLIVGAVTTCPIWKVSCASSASRRASASPAACRTRSSPITTGSPTCS